MRKIFGLSIALIIFLSIASWTEAASSSLYLAPSGGTFLVGSTFSLSLFVDTKGDKINAAEVDLRFPPDILQITAPTAGQSFISQWLTPPSYSNSGGTISFRGGIPEGIITSAGLISTITFRAKASGIARIEILDSSKVLLSDGKGTPVLTVNIGGQYQILIPPPEGPRIFSSTHPDQEKWYADSNPSFSWEKEEGITDFSYLISQSSGENPDILAEGEETFKSYQDIPDGIWYFHLRAKKKGVWGKTSHFSFKIDNSPPEKFEPRADLFSGLVYFETKDIFSGIEHYEISLINADQNPGLAPFFVEATSPYKIPKFPGKYNLVVRAFDRVGNNQTAQIQFQVLSSVLSLEKGGIQFRGIFIPGLPLIIVLFILLGIILFLIFYSLRWRGVRKGIKEIKEALREIEKIEEKEKKEVELKQRFQEEKARLEEKLK